MATCETATVAPLSRALYWLANWTVLFRAGDNIFVTFGLFAALGAFLGGAWTSALLLGAGVPVTDTAALVAAILVGHVLFARAFLLPWRLRGLLGRPLETLRTVEFASWGGFVAIAVGLGLYAALSGRSLLGLMDAAALGGALGHAVGRIGCLTLGCCFGRPTDWLLAVRYDSPTAKASWSGGLQGVPVHPVPLYEFAFNLALFVLLNAIAVAGSREGVPTGLYLLLYGNGRFLLERLRYSPPGDHIGPLPRNQWLSIVAAGAGAALLLALAQGPGPSAPSFAATGWQSLALLPLVAACAAVVFVAYSLHRGSLGRW